MILRKTVAILLTLFVSGAAVAAQLPQPDGRPILTVTGLISQSNSDGMARFDIAMLRDLDWVEIETHTSFTEGPQVFAGPTLSSLLAVVGSEGSRFNAKAINGYFVEIPAAHAAAHNVILAIEHNGKPMRIRDKGPIWVVYPLTEAQAEAKPFDTEMIWQLEEIEILP